MRSVAHADAGGWFLGFGVAAMAAVTVCAFLVGLPPEDADMLGALAVLAVGTGLWLTGLLPRWHDRALVLACLVGFGLCGAVLDYLQPHGPGTVAVFLAVAGLGFLLPPHWSVWGALPVLVAGAAVEARNAQYPFAAVVSIVISAILLLIVSSFAAASRDGRDQAERLLAQEAATLRSREEAAALAERGRLAREIHDVLSHTLSGLAVQLEGARLLSRECADPRLTDQVTHAQRLAAEGLVSAKRAISTLRGDPMPNPDQLPQLVAATRLATSAPIALRTVGEPRPMSPEAGLAVYRTVQEALTNVAKHAGHGAEVAIRLTYAPSQVEVEVTNAGGNDVPTRPSDDGLGLSGMAERAALLGGYLEAGPVIGGFRIRLAVPTA